ncbi:MAG TPA: alkaline phosphatase family protein, partial [Turneriella sp.]|nr:alkaline phosphatase family protein [Turneriella sp.]
MKFFFYAFVIFSSALFASPQKRRLIIWSIDGFAAAYLTNPEFQKIKVWQRLLKRAQLFTPVETVIPALTYPAHTAMVTGHETANHRLYG